MADQSYKLTKQYLKLTHTFIEYSADK